MRALAFAVFSLMLFAQPAFALQAKEDPLMVTAICDEHKSRATALRLLDFSRARFSQFNHVPPRTEQVSREKLFEDGPDAEFHAATFNTFRADFIREPNGNRTLVAMSTKSPAFKLPFGLKLGQSMEQVRKILGPPSFINSKIVGYEVGGEAISDVLFYFEANNLVEVAWSFGMAD
ncbi:hypothetical protein ABT364_15995 [Massilia sp. SR12]